MNDASDDPARPLREENRLQWDERAGFHLDTPMYRGFVQKLRDGGDALLPFDDAVLGDLTGLRVLHLQCHVGTDTLSLARRGATVTGVDFSAEALDRARSLSESLGIPATFLQSDVYDLPNKLEDRFDLVYTSYGVLCWLNDIRRWARVAAQFVAPGGRLITIDSHPVASALEDEPAAGEPPRLTYPYLEHADALTFEEAGSYANPDAATTHDRSHEWNRGLGEIVQAVLDAGLSLEQLREHPEGYWARFPGMERSEDGLYRLPAAYAGRFPLTFTLVARRP